MPRGKIIFGDEVLIDLTSDTITPSTLKKGVTAHDKSGAIIIGTSTLDVDTSETTVTADEILEGKTAGVRGSIIKGSMPNNGSIDKTIATKSQVLTIPMGYHDGGGKIRLDPTEASKLIPNNIRSGVELFGILGNMTGSKPVTAQAKTVTPTIAPQTVTPDPGTDYLSQVKVEGIPYKEVPNSAGGTTVTIG